MYLYIIQRDKFHVLEWKKKIDRLYIVKNELKTSRDDTAREVQVAQRESTAHTQHVVSYSIDSRRAGGAAPIVRSSEICYYFLPAAAESE